MQRKLKEKELREKEKKKMRFNILLRNKKEIKKQSSKVMNEKIKQQTRIKKIGSQSMTDLKTPKLVPRQSDQSLLDAFKIQTLANKI